MKYFIFFCFSICFFMCQNKYNGQKEIIEKITKNNLKKHLYIITSLDGCSACLAQGVRFIEDNIDKNNICVIVSGKSKIALNSTFKKSTINNKNFVKDTSLIALREGLINVSHPKIYLSDKGEILEEMQLNYLNADSVINASVKYLNTFVDDY